MDEICLTLAEESVPVCVRVNPRARRLILKVDPISGNVQLTVPDSASVPDALAFAQRQTDWITRQRAKIAPVKPFASNMIVPLRGEAHQIRHQPAARRGVWHDPKAALICVSGEADHVTRRVTDWLKREARSDLTERVGVHSAALGVRAQKICIRDTRSRWGSCSATGTLSFSWRLILSPAFVLDYVAAHEVAHLKHHDHSPAFWARVRELTPHTGEATGWLRRHGSELHRFGKAPELG